MASSSSLTYDYEVLVIGGGAAGLRTADLLAEAGVRVALLEARERFGGRVHRFQLESGAELDAGGCASLPPQMSPRRCCALTIASSMRRFLSMRSMLQRTQPVGWPDATARAGAGARPRAADVCSICDWRRSLLARHSCRR